MLSFLVYKVKCGKFPKLIDRKGKIFKISNNKKFSAGKVLSFELNEIYKESFSFQKKENFLDIDV